MNRGDGGVQQEISSFLGLQREKMIFEMNMMQGVRLARGKHLPMVGHQGKLDDQVIGGFELKC